MSMKGPYLTKRENLRQVSLRLATSMQVEKYFVRYLHFQNKLVKKINLDTLES